MGRNVTDNEALTELLWVALKKQCCVNPTTAVRIVIVNREDVLRAISTCSVELNKLLTLDESGNSTVGK